MQNIAPRTEFWKWEIWPTVVLESFANEVIGGGAVPVVPHEGGGQTGGGGGQRVHPPHLDAVLLAEPVIVGLAVVVAMLGPTGKPICNNLWWKSLAFLFLARTSAARN